MEHGSEEPLAKRQKDDTEQPIEGTDANMEQPIEGANMEQPIEGTDANGRRPGVIYDGPPRDGVLRPCFGYALPPELRAPGYIPGMELADAPPRSRRAQ